MERVRLAEKDGEAPTSGIDRRRQPGGMMATDEVLLKPKDSLDSDVEEVYPSFKEGGEAHEMDVSSCYSLFDLRFVAPVLSKT